MPHINIQFATDKRLAPSAIKLRLWARHALREQTEAGEVTIRVVAVDEMTQLNEQYRRKKGPTNVLSFPLTIPKEISLKEPLFGDIIICAPIVNEEAKQQNKIHEAHWAHMVIHGVFHLLGFDHETDQEADIMEALEIKTLKQLGFANPYYCEED